MAIRHCVRAASPEAGFDRPWTWPVADPEVYIDIGVVVHEKRART